MIPALSTGYARWRGALAGLAIWPVLFCAGCPSLESLPTQAPVMSLKEDATQRPYLLYVPSSYKDDRPWPFVVVCHGTWPYDTPDLQMREWALFAENVGLIVAAPKLVGTMGDFPPPAEKQIALQREDEKAILALVAAVKRRYHIAEERVFMTGWSAGAYAILYTGLRHPDIFRGLYVRQGSFDARFMDIPADRLDRWQAIKVVYGKTDVLRDQTLESIKWLRNQGQYVDEQEITGSHRRIDPKMPWDYFKDVVKRRLWVRVRAKAVDPEKPLVVRFDVDAVPPVVERKWFFGDGSESRDESPKHKYAQPGKYEVTVNVQMKNGKTYARRKTIQVGGPPGED